MGRKEAKKESFLNNLGRANMRGLKRCCKCGTLNGTRGFTCKNKMCDVIFKNVDNVKKKGVNQPCKIISGSDTQIYSVRVRDRGPDYRGFVQFPSEQNETNMFPDIYSAEMLAERAKCYVESCQRDKYMPIANQPQKTCIHIKSALECCKISKPLTLKASVLNSLSIPQSYKNDLYHLAVNTRGPLVQRVSLIMFVVKCKPDLMHPLGYLHFSFNLAKKKDSDRKFYCSCRSFKYNQHFSKDLPHRKCVHLYACIAGFASDSSLSKEFSQYIDLILNEVKLPNFSLDLVLPNKEESMSNEDDIQSHEEDGQEYIPSLEDVEVSTSSSARTSILPSLEGASPPRDSMEPMDERSFLLLSDEDGKYSPCEVEVEVDIDQSQFLQISQSDHTSMSESKGVDFECEKETEICLDSSSLDSGNCELDSLAIHHFPVPTPILPRSKKHDTSIVTSQSHSLTHSFKKVGSRKRENRNDFLFWRKKLKMDSCDESSTSLRFVKWLSSVTEAMNQSMHYGSSGKTDSLVFKLPKSFFDCLAERIMKTGKKHKLSIETEQIVNKDTQPLGKFTKFTIKLTSTKQVQQIFSTPDVPFEPVRYFSAQKDGSFKLIPPSQQYSNSYDSGSDLDNPVFCDGTVSAFVKTKVLKTVLKVGSSSYNSSATEVPFIIEWTPNILPISQVGELRIRFEYDQFCNRQIVDKNISASTPIIISRVAIPSNRKSLGPPLAPKPPVQKMSHFSSTDRLISLSDGVGGNDTITVLTI